MAAWELQSIFPSIHMFICEKTRVNMQKVQWKLCCQIEALEKDWKSVHVLLFLYPTKDVCIDYIRSCLILLVYSEPIFLVWCAKMCCFKPRHLSDIKIVTLTLTIWSLLSQPRTSCFTWCLLLNTNVFTHYTISQLP